MALCEPWAVSGSLCSPCDDYALDAALVEEKLLAASETLYILSGSQFPGECEVTIRPCFLSSSHPYAQPSVSFRNGQAYNEGGCHCRTSDNCSCPSLSEFYLPHTNVIEVTEVKRDGAIWTEHRLDPPNIFVSLGDPLPCCQNMSLADTEEDTWSITYTHGLAPPTLGVTAAAILACEFYMACDPEAFEGQCRLPSNVVTIARQGVTISKLVGELFVARPGQQVRFGIPEIDLFLATWGNAGSIIVSPDDPPVARITG